MPAKISLPTAVTRMTADDAIERKELAWVAGLAAAKQDPAAVAAALDPVAGKMTGRARDVFDGFKKAMSPPPPPVDPAAPPATVPMPTPPMSPEAALELLAKKSLDKKTMPAWLPAAYDMAVATAGAKAILVAQGEPEAGIVPGACDKIIFTDADLTLLKTDTPTVLKHKTTGAFAKHPGTGRLLLLHDVKPEMNELKAKYPTFPWDDYAADYREFGSIAEILRTASIAQDVRLLKKSDRDPKSRDFVITARSDDAVPAALDEYLTQRGIDINGVFAVNSPLSVAKLGFTDPAIKSGMRKAIAMAGVMLAYGGDEHVKKVKFLDDGDDNLQAAMQLLPRMFPGTSFEFFDVEHTGNNKFKQKLIAKTGEGGELFKADGTPFSNDAITGYTDNDLPLPHDERLYPHMVVDHLPAGAVEMPLPPPATAAPPV